MAKRWEKDVTVEEFNRKQRNEEDKIPSHRDVFIGIGEVADVTV